MATREEIARELTRPVSGWHFNGTADAPLRRPLFIDGDRFHFSVGDCCCRLVLRVVGGDDVLVLGGDLTLDWNATAAAFVAHAYGRFMEFSAAPAQTETGWAMVYRCEYDDPPHNAPDEGGDGDPK
ncbi:MAG: hypothetical protein AMXMBFR59_35930 [Rhodanobacteraceae bacterium]